MTDMSRHRTRHTHRSMPPMMGFVYGGIASLGIWAVIGGVICLVA